MLQHVQRFLLRDDATGRYTGVTVDLGDALAQELGVPVEIHPFMNSGACTTALENNVIDVTFLPVDDERRGRVAFGPAYYNIQSTYLVTTASNIHTLADVDREEVRVVGIANTTTIRSAARTLKSTVPKAVESIAEAIDLLNCGQADALALSREAFATLLPFAPGAFPRRRVPVDWNCRCSAAGPTCSLSYVSNFIEKAKRSGLVRRVLDSAGFPDEPVA